jgi:hypothetical protein
MSAPQKAIDFILANAKHFAAAKAKRVHLEEFRKSKKALLMRDAMLRGIEAANAQEREAYAHPEYLELLEGLASAIETEEMLKWKLEAARMRVDVWRSEEATNRATDKAMT